MLAEDVSAQANPPFAISPDNRLIAVVAGSEIRFAPVAALPAFQPLVRARMPTGCALVDLRWSPTSDSLLVLCYPAPGAKISQLLRIDATSGKMQMLPSPVRRLLGWHPSGQLVVVREGPAFDEAALLNPDGSMLSWGTRREPSEVYILAYAQGPGLVLEVTPSEDPGDPVSVYLRPPGECPVRRWLRGYPQLSDIKFSLDGTWATFADRRLYGASGMPGGNIYIVGTASEDAHVVIGGVPGVRSYSSPALRP